MLHPCFLTRSLGVVVSLLLCHAIAYGEVSIVALTGDVAPATGGARFAAISRSVINNNGDVAFAADLSGGTSLRGIFKLHEGVLYPIVLQGQVASPESGATFWSFSEPGMNQAGDIAFVASIHTDSTPLSYGVFVASGSSVRKVVDQDNAVPGLAGAQFDIFRSVHINDQGEVAFHATLRNTIPSGSTGIFVVKTGVLNALVIGGQLVNGNTLGSIGSDFALNNSGHILFSSSVDGNDVLILFSGANTFQSVAVSGQAVPGSSVLLDGFGELWLNDNDEVVFINLQIIIAKVTMSESNAVIHWRDGNIRVVTQIGDTIPVAGNPSIHNSLSYPQINNIGTILFGARIGVNPSNMAVITVEDGNLFLRIQETQTLEGVGKFTFLGNPRINDRGLITFRSDLDTSQSGVFTLQAPHSRLLFPQIADGVSGGVSWRTCIQLANREIADAHVSVQFYGDDGNPTMLSIQDQDSSQFTFTIPPLGTLKLDTQGLGELKTGWAIVTADQSLSGIAIFSSFDTEGGLLDAVGTGAAIDHSSLALFSAWSGNDNTAVAIANPGDSTATFTLTLRDSSGAVWSTVNRTLPPKAHMAKYLFELLDREAIPPSFQGRVELLSDLPVIAVGLRQQGPRWTSLPVIQ